MHRPRRRCGVRLQRRTLSLAENGVLRKDGTIVVPFFVDLDVEHTTALPREELVLFGAEVVRPSLLEHFPDNPDMRDAELVVCAPAKPKTIVRWACPCNGRVMQDRSVDADLHAVVLTCAACGKRYDAGSGAVLDPEGVPASLADLFATPQEPAAGAVPRARAVTTYKSSCHYRIRNREAEGLRRRYASSVCRMMYTDVCTCEDPGGGHPVPGAVTPQQAFSITCNVQYSLYHPGLPEVRRRLRVARPLRRGALRATGGDPADCG